MTRLTSLILLAVAAVTFSPATASAQYPRYGFGFSYNGPGVLPPLPSLPPLQPLPRLAPLPPLNPYTFYNAPQYNYQYTTRVTNYAGTATLTTRTFYSGFTPSPVYAYPGSYGYNTGIISYPNTGGYPSFVLEAQRDLARVQRTATTSSYVVEKPDPVLPDPVAKVLAPADRARILSGDALNDVLAEVVKAETKVGARVSAFVPPLQLDVIRFGGSDAAEVLNLARRDTLAFPIAFDNPALKEVRTDLARDFAPVATALQAGKSPDATKRAQLEATLQRAESALAPLMKDLPFADATAARRFLNDLTKMARAIKGGAGAGLIDPKWATEGTTVADLVKHMKRHKLQFGAVPEAEEEPYTTLHRNLSAYLFLLTQPKK